MKNNLWKFLFRKSRLVLIGIENYNREYDGKFLLAKKLSSEGYNVILAHKSIIRSLVKFCSIRQQIYIDKDANTNSGKRNLKAKTAGLNIFCFEEEGLLRNEADQFLIKSYKPISIKSIDGIFSWGEKHSKILKKAGYKSKQIIKTGNPRFDPYKLKASKFSNSERKYILICSRFGKANPNKKLNENDLPSYWKNYIKETKEILKTFIEIPNKIRLAGIQTPIIIRPHPSESPEIWRRVTKSLPNIVITNSSPLINTLPRTKLIIHNRCTTSIEAFMSNIPVISYEPIELTKDGSAPPEDIFNSISSFIAKDHSELIDSIFYVENNYSSYINLDKSILKNSPYLYSVNKLAFVEIANYLKINYSPEEYGINFFKMLEIILVGIAISFYYYCLRVKQFIFDRKGYKYYVQKTAKPPNNSFFCKFKDHLLFGLPVNIRLFLPLKYK